MKAFAFRLQQVLEWRATELNVQRARAAVATANVSSIESQIRAEQANLSSAATLVPAGATGLGLDSWAGFRRRSQMRVRELETQLLAARKATEAEMSRLVEARRKVRVLENLETRARDQWRRDFDHELAAFAEETSLLAVNRRAQSPARDARPPSLPTTATAHAAVGLPAASGEAR